MGKLEDTFNIPDTINEIVEKADQICENMEEDDNLLEQVSNMVNSINLKKNLDMETYDKEMDEISDATLREFSELVTIGKDVETRHMGEVFSAAAQMAKIAHDARTNKMNARIKWMELELRKQRNDQIQDKQDFEMGEKGQGVEQGQSYDRNDIIDLLDQWKKKGEK